MPHRQEEYLIGNSGKRKTTSICFHAHVDWFLPQRGLSRFSANRASDRTRTTPKEMEMEGVPVRRESGRADPASGESQAQAQIPLSHRGRGPRAPSVHPWFRLPGPDRSPTATPTPHSYSPPFRRPISSRTVVLSRLVLPPPAPGPPESQGARVPPAAPRS